jgi:hypothetical protein
MQIENIKFKFLILSEKLDRQEKKTGLQKSETAVFKEFADGRMAIKKTVCYKTVQKGER